MSDEKKTKPHECKWRDWIKDVYTPWYNGQVKSAEGENDGDEGGNPGGPPPPPPPGDDDDDG